ncbi:hypothetical protein [Streptomyces sp. NPDC060001]|uniref:hypothetical protein n=1 Tax=Streptomyces sp. NPDC060001 TaxID=3347032 RepID=UPI0036B3F3F8
MPSPQDYATRREAYAAWLTANAISPGIVLMDADVTIVTKDDGSRVIAYEGCDLTTDGHKQPDERGTGVATRRFETPLLVEPPDWWEPYEKPTRDDLLEVLGRVQSAAEQTPPGGDGVAGEYEFGWDAAMAAVKNALRESVTARSA